MKENGAAILEEKGESMSLKCKYFRVSHTLSSGPVLDMHSLHAEDSLRATGIQGVDVDTELYVSNLDHGVTKEDIRTTLGPMAICEEEILNINESNLNEPLSQLTISDDNPMDNRRDSALGSKGDLRKSPLLWHTYSMEHLVDVRFELGSLFDVIIQAPPTWKMASKDR
ncbi:hypothetical protein RIF29_00879 [Crotalaria pallida]|uniref:Uncharacterized protein n=1 Tax=Crotalaria pallida TaxID=3830 RepID=A0AAN9P6T9_CROPI